MRTGWRLALAAVTIGVAGPGRAAPPLAAFGHLPSVDLIALSPDGSKVALVVGDATGRELQVRRVGDRHVLSRVRLADAKVRALQWAGEDHLLVTRSTTADVFGLMGPRREYLLVLDLDLQSHKQTALLANDVGGGEQRLNTVQAIPEPRIIAGRPVVFLEGIAFKAGQGVLTLFRVDLQAHRTTTVSEGTTETGGWLVDSGGVPVARTDYNERSGRWTLYAGTGGRLAKVMDETHPLDGPWLAGFGRTPGTLLIGTHDDDATVYRELPATGGAAVAVPEMTDGTPVADPVTQATIGTSRHEDLAVRYRFFAPADAALWAKVARGFGDAVVHLESWSDDRRTMILRVEGKAFGAAYFLLDVATRHADWLVNEYAEIAAEDLGEKRAIHYPAADGTDIPAYLTLPPGGADKKPPGGADRKLPLVVLAHGGPSARDDPGFDWWAQALASRGYAVLQPQFRGSAGFGARFLAAGYGEWGRKMQTDLSDGVAYLAKAGTIDPQRVAIVGGSYGGYAALAGVTLQHGIYRAAVSLAGPADLRAMLDYERSMTGGTKNRTLRHWQRFMGAASPSDPVLATISPVKFAAAADAPVLLLHGADDTVVPFDQSKAMAAALTKAGKPVELVRLAGEDHWLSRSATRAAMLDATAAFLARYLPVGGAAGAAAAP